MMASERGVHPSEIEALYRSRFRVFVLSATAKRHSTLCRRDSRERYASGNCFEATELSKGGSGESS
jgi:hypothetical protein